MSLGFFLIANELRFLFPQHLVQQPVQWCSGNSPVWMWQDPKWTHASHCVGEDCWLRGTRPPWRDSNFVCVSVCVFAAKAMADNRKNIPNMDSYILFKYMSFLKAQGTKWQQALEHCIISKSCKTDASKLQTACPHLPTQLVRDTLQKTIQKRRARQQISQSSFLWTESFLTDTICVQMLRSTNEQCANASVCNVIHPAPKRQISSDSSLYQWENAVVSPAALFVCFFHLFWLEESSFKYLPTPDTLKRSESS